MAQTTREQTDTPARSLNGLMLVAAVVSAVSGLLYGYDTGIISGALLQISKEFHTGNGMEQTITAGILLGAVIGALGGSFLSERFGRHPTILLICAIFIAGSLSCSLAPTAVRWHSRACCWAWRSVGRRRPCPCTSRSSHPPRSGGGSCSASSWPSASAS